MLVLLSILTLAFCARAWSINFGLPYKYHIDEPSYVLAALNIDRGNLNIVYPPFSPNIHEILLALLYGVLFVVQYLTGSVSSPVAFASSYQQDPSIFYLIGRALSASFSLLAISVLYLVVQRLRGTRAALSSALLLAACFLDVRHAHFVEPYSLVALLALICMYAAINYVSNGGVLWMVVSGAASGVAIGIRFSVIPLGLVPLTAILICVSSKNAEHRTRTLVQSLILMAGAMFGGLVLGTPSLLLNPDNFRQGIFAQTTMAVTTQGFWGIKFTDWPTWQFYGRMLEVAWGLPLTFVIVIGFGRALVRHHAEDVLLLIFPLTFGLVLFSASAQSSAFARYLVPILPFLAFFASDGMLSLVNWVVKFRLESLRGIVLAAAVALSVAVPVARTMRLDWLWTQTDTRTRAKIWVEDNIPAGARVASQWYGPPLGTPTDPETDSKRVYDVQVLDPFSADPDSLTLDYYLSCGYDYIIVSSFIYNLHRVDAAEDRMRSAFYDALNKQATLIAEFKPYIGSEPAFIFEQMWGPITDVFEFTNPGPTIRIYKLSR